MRRLHGALTALALAAVAGPARGAEIARVVSSGEPGDPFNVDVGVRWDRSVESATITRERCGSTGPCVLGDVIVEGDERLRYTRTRNAIVPRVAVGLWKDLELHAELPYVLGDDREWSYGTYKGAASGPNPTDPQSIAGNTIDASGQPCPSTPTTPCPLFPVPATGYHGGRDGDLKAGIAWGIFNDRKDDTKPSWLVGMDLTFPTAAKWEPGKGRTSAWESPYGAQANPGPFGEKIWKWDVYTVLSKRYGRFDPYLKAHAQLAFKSSSTYSNCDRVLEATAATPSQMNSEAVANCASWGSAAGAKLPFVAGVTVGAEVIPYEDARESQRLALDFRLFTDVTSKQRFYNELSDATGKLLQTEGYMEMGGLAGVYLHASRWVLIQAQASYSTRTAHYLTGESLYKNGWPASGQAVTPASVNPNFDWRYDAPGRRFRISEVGIFELSFGGVLQF